MDSSAIGLVSIGVSILVQTAAVVWKISQMAAEIKSLTTQLARHEARSAEKSVVDERLRTLQQRIEGIDLRLTRLEQLK